MKADANVCGLLHTLQLTWPIMRLSWYVLIVVLVAALAATTRLAADSDADTAQHAPGQTLNLVFGAPGAQDQSLLWLRQNWRADFAGMLIESLRYIRSPATRRDAATLLEDKTKQTHGLDIDAWYHWLWQRDTQPHPDYAQFKSALYAKIDPRFVAYFSQINNPRIRLDEIRWGGVRQNGIPPLRQPKMLAANQADYLEDDNVVFAVNLNGDARAYPKRIMGHHEMFIDTVGGIPVAGVYCTLCGAMIIYETDGHSLGTSGFLYRSNKVMFDEETDSLWSTLLGYPVAGPLVNKDIVLKRRPVVTTTWGEWRARHPDTTVLDVDTGFRRDYSEGSAYNAYFATDDLMFTVPTQVADNTLANKAEVLALRDGDAALAISADYLQQHRVYHDQLNGQNLVVVTDASGANRVFAAENYDFKSLQGEHELIDAQQRTWQITEDHLIGPAQEKLPRLPAHRAFWFGWKAGVPNTRLVH